MFKLQRVLQIAMATLALIYTLVKLSLVYMLHSYHASCSPLFIIAIVLLIQWKHWSVTAMLSMFIHVWSCGGVHVYNIVTTNKSRISKQTLYWMFYYNKVITITVVIMWSKDEIHEYMTHFRCLQCLDYPQDHAFMTLI